MKRQFEAVKPRLPSGEDSFLVEFERGSEVSECHAAGSMRVRFAPKFPPFPGRDLSVPAGPRTLHEDLPR